MTRISMMRQSCGLFCLAALTATAGCSKSSTAPTVAVTASIKSFTGQAPIVTAVEIPTPHPYPSLHVDVQWPDDVTGLNGQIVLTILDSSGVLIARTHDTGPLSKGGSVPYSMGIATYTPSPFQGTVVVKLTNAPCGNNCTPANDLCAPGGVRGTPVCKPIPDLPGPYLSEITRTIMFN
jgi:hypothetical protein